MSDELPEGFALLLDLKMAEAHMQLADAQREIKRLRQAVENVAIVTAYDQPLPGCIGGHTKVVIGDFEKRAEQAEAQVRALRPIVKLLADLFDDPDARHIVLGWFDEEQIRQALATPPPAPTEPTP